MSYALDDGQEEHEEGYFASMTDIMVGLLFIFIIIIMFFALQIRDVDADAVPRALLDEARREIVTLEADRAALNAENEGLKATVTALVAERTTLKAENEEFKATVADLSEEIEQLRAIVAQLGPLSAYQTNAERQRRRMLETIVAIMKAKNFGSIEYTEEQDGIRLPNELLFGSGSYDIASGDPERALGALASALKAVLPCYTLGAHFEETVKQGCNPHGSLIEAVLVEGHTDDSKIGGQLAKTVPDNLALSSRRAEATYRRLLAADPTLASFLSPGERQVLSVASYGDKRPIRGSTDKSTNRRIELRFLMHTPTSASLRELQTKFGIAALDSARTQLFAPPSALAEAGGPGAVAR